MIRNVVFSCRKVGSIKGYFCRYIINYDNTPMHYTVLQNFTKVQSMQRPGTEAIRTQIQPSQPKQEITKITNSQNIKGRYGQPSKQLLSKRWPLSKPNRTKTNMNTNKLKRHRNSDTTNRQQRTTMERSVA